MIYTGSKALQYLTIALFTIFKNLTIIIIAYFERLFIYGTPVNGLMLGSFFCMVLSSILAGKKRTLDTLQIIIRLGRHKFRKPLQKPS